MSTDESESEFEPPRDWAPEGSPPIDLDAIPAEGLADAEDLLFGLDLADEADRTRARLRLAAHQEQDDELVGMFSRGEQTMELEWHLIAARVSRRGRARAVALALVEKHDGI